MTKNVVITGSTRGIGYEMAMVFLQNGCNVTFSGRKESLQKQFQERLKPYIKQYNYVPCNVQNKKDLQQLWNSAVKQWGKVDIWINNAGQNSPSKWVWETDEKSTKAVIETNVVGMIIGSQIAAENMLKQGEGAIYSMEGLGSNDMIQPKTAIYGTSKRALTYFMKALAAELKGTPVVAGRLSPGMMLTDFITKTPEGKPSIVIKDAQFKKVFNILADTPETVANFLVPKMLNNRKNDVHFVWLTNAKAALRFMTAPFIKRKLI